MLFSRSSSGLRLVEGLEIGCTPRVRRPFRDDLHPEGMKRADPHFDRRGGVDRGNTFPHLIGGLVGEGEREDGSRLSVVEQKANTFNERTGLARTRPASTSKGPFVHVAAVFWLSSSSIGAVGGFGGGAGLRGGNSKARMS